MSNRTLLVIIITTFITLQLLSAKAQSLDMRVSTNKKSYRLGEEVIVQGIVLENGNPVANAVVSVTVKDPSEKVVFSESLETNFEGIFEVTLIIGTDWSLGKYLVDVVAYVGDETVAATAYFYVREPSTITIEVPNNVTLGGAIEIQGSITPEPGRVRVVVHVLGPVNETLITFTDEHGEFTVEYIPPKAGEYKVYAEWSGTSTIEGSVSDTVNLLVLRKPSKILLSLSKRIIRYEQSVTIEGCIEPREAGANQEVTLTYKLKGSEEVRLIAKVNADINGTFTLTWTPPRAGEYEIIASWNGTEDYKGSHVTTVLIVKKAPSSIEISLEPNVIELGHEVTTKGSLHPAIEGVYVIIEAKSNVGWIEVARAVVEDDGSFSCKWVPEHAGTYEIRAVWLGNENYESAISNSLELTVKRAKTIIHLTVSKESIALGERLQIIGLVESLVTGEAIPNAVVKLKLISPRGSTFTLTANASELGNFSIPITLDYVGSWTLIASWDGDEDYIGSTSSNVSVSVKGIVVKGVIVYFKRAFPVQDSLNNGTKRVDLELQATTNSTLKKVLIEGATISMELKNPENSTKYLVISIPKESLESLGLSIEDLRLITKEPLMDLKIEELLEAYMIRLQFNSSSLELFIRIGCRLRLNLIDQKGRAISGALVNLYKGEELLNSSLTNIEGLCDFLALPRSKYKLLVYWMGDEILREEFELTSDLVYNKTIEVYDLIVVVRGLLGLPVRGVFIKVTCPNNETLLFTTGEHGVAVIKQLPKGEYKVVISSISSVTREVTLEGDLELLVNLTTTLDIVVLMIVILATLIALLTIRERHIRLRSW